ncbi:MAG TPA: long-chain fatty acid--CoA ligase [Roseiflexaceae bacterium]|nr:long-chain fatty acid--CoA ligase [Roseiflexaceae bacterium]
MNIAQHVERNRGRFPHQNALTFEGKTYTYVGLDELANRAANGLRGLGVARGDRVALFLPNIPEFIFCYLGALKIGAVVVSVNAMLKRDEVRFILEDSGAVALVTTAGLVDQVPEGGVGALRHIVIAEGVSARGVALDTLMGRSSSYARAAAMHRDDPAAIVYTSGTTGFPKGATLSHGNVISCMAAKNTYCQTRPHDRLLLTLPLFHCFGQNAILNNGLNAGATIVLQRRFDPERTLAAIGEDNVTMMFGVPTLFIKLLELRPDRRTFQSVRYFFTAGAPMPPWVVEQWRHIYGALIYEGYGLTETSPFASYNHASEYRAGSVGTPISHVEMRVVGDDGQPLPPGERGEIVVRGPNVMLGYWNRPDATAAVIRDGWFHTGDIGTVDEQGYFYVLDRLKDMINVSGFKVYPAEVEAVLGQHNAVAEAAVYGLPDSVRGEAVHASVVLRPGYTTDADDLLGFCRHHIAGFKVPQSVRFVQALPKNATGKVLRRQLRQDEPEQAAVPLLAREGSA